MSVFFSLSFLAALLLVQVNAHTHDELSEQYTYNVQLDNEGRYTMFYSYDTELSILRIAVLVQTTGWIGLGISPNGQMPASDVVMGWVDGSGQTFLQVTTLNSSLSIKLQACVAHMHVYICSKLHLSLFTWIGSICICPYCSKP